MIERLLAADRALESGQLEVADRLYAQVAAADPRNAIAIVGLARAANARGDRPAALAHVRRALEIDPDDAAAQKLLTELEPEPAANAVAAAHSAAATAPTAGPTDAPRGPVRRREGFIAWLMRIILGRD